MGVRLGLIEHDGPDYQQAVQLRERVLRAPLGLGAASKLEQQAEGSSFHFGAWQAQQLVACLVLTPESSGGVRMRQVAVEPSHQNQGLGTQLVRAAEEFARARGFREITLHAREAAIPFYERLGYEAYGQPFIEVTVAHRAMRKLLSEAPS